MTQEQKELLLKDLCGRLLYGVKVEYDKYAYEVLSIDRFNEELTIWKYPGYYPVIKLEDVKPYLFPLSSMTEEQRVEAFALLNNCDYYTIDNTIKWLDNHPIKFFDWCNKNHFDYRGLIPMGLAIDATGLNIY